ncbi:MAG: CoA activase [Desulfobacteraceae bacterium]|nr:CoA activase [Desulfobacteraceae bacterium]
MNSERKQNIAVIGIDVGSVSVSIAALDDTGKIFHLATAYHYGDVKPCLSNLLAEDALKNIGYISKTASSPSYIFSQAVFDEQVSIIRTSNHLHTNSFGGILHIGGEKFSLSLFDQLGNYIGAKHNTSCAAGTGSFLDQQAGRLNLAGSEQISQQALSNKKNRPDIATRCAVFAKTDLIHAQQEGYDIEQICDGLCFGLAKNIANTLFKQKTLVRQNTFDSKILFCGGVSKNICVKNHLESITGIKFFIDEYSQFYGAIGAALNLKDQLNQDIHESKKFSCIDDYFKKNKKKESYRYPQLELKLSDYPDFTCFKSYILEGVEIDIYKDPQTCFITQGFLGLDVGSTSTKAILIDQTSQPIAGFYTQTASRPVEAVKKLFKTCDSFLSDHHLKIEIKGCGTTGSGRRIAGKIIGADIEPDEITAHATAAVNLNNEVDTIIEIGGQDAKFTLIKNGMVTSSVMNTVCAAGTGSFIEEQANKLDCPLSNYSARTEGVTSPVSSDRCTVFMERDINYFFAEGYEKNEILASVLHSVRDNYLTKVANIGKIGNTILFQGATARNKALVAAFEQKLNKPIHVSKFCHLTGALGVALLALEQKRNQKIEQTNFRGFDLWTKDIPVRQETCLLCTNHCKLTIADIEGSPQAYGFLCGRDYETKKMVPQKNRYDLLRLRKQQTRINCDTPVKHDFTIGIPAALHLFEDLEFWQHFFSNLGIRTITSKGLKNPVKQGQTIANAEFCAPVVSLHGHVSHLMKKADYVFLPFYFEDKLRAKETRRQHCYYTQFTPSIIACLQTADKKRLISPIIQYLYTNFHTKMELYKSLKTLSSELSFSFYDLVLAYDRAIEFKRKTQEKLKELYRQENQATPGIKALFLGRPYTILAESMNNNIPEIFTNLGIKTFFQDMMDNKNHDFSMIQPLLKEIHWKHAAKILEVTYIAATTKDLYPVYISSFKCAPDSFAVDYFKEIMEHFNKPYLVLELDEHDSSVGYETRIEAAVRAFTNHYNQADNKPVLQNKSFQPSYATALKQKTIIFPNWDSFTGQLLVATLKNEGYDALLMEETQQTLKQSILTNTGQCIPLNAIGAGFIQTVKNHNLNPSKAVLWLNQSEIACNIKMYPYHINKILEREKNGFEQAQIYKGELSLFDISFKASTNAYYAYMFGGLFRSIGCKIRPYEVNKGETDRVLSSALSIIGAAFLTGGSKEKALKETISMLSKISINKGKKRPKVAIFGDLYVRDNDTMNQDLVHFIEENGGEVVTTPYYKYIKIIANSYFKKWFKEGKYLSLISNKALLTAMQAMEKKYYKYFEVILNESDFIVTDSYEKLLEQYGILPEHTGESMDNILKIHHIINEHPDLRLLVQTNPAFCCAGLVTEAMAAKIEAKTKVPIVSITYDVSGGNKNKVIIPFLKVRHKYTYSHNKKVSV